MYPAESILKEATKKVKRVSMAYTGSEARMVWYGFEHERIGHSKGFVHGKVYFWSCAKEADELSLNEGEKLVYHLKWLEFRYNNGGNLDEMVYDCLSKKMFRWYILINNQTGLLVKLYGIRIPCVRGQFAPKAFLIIII